MSCDLLLRPFLRFASRLCSIVCWPFTGWFRVFSPKIASRVIHGLQLFFKAKWVFTRNRRRRVTEVQHLRWMKPHNIDKTSKGVVQARTSFQPGLGRSNNGVVRRNCWQIYAKTDTKQTRLTRNIERYSQLCFLLVFCGFDVHDVEADDSVPVFIPIVDGGREMLVDTQFANVCVQVCTAFGGYFFNAKQR